MKKTLLGLFTLLAISLLAGKAISGDQAATDMPRGVLAGAALLEALRGGGYVIYLRHTASNPEQVDQDSLILGDCGTQRNLSDQGREQAVAIGEAFRTLGITVSAVIASPYCRARDTARLAFGHADTSDDLRFSIGAGDVQTAVRAAALRRLLATAPAPGGNSVIVAHTANLKDATDIWPKPEGVAVIFRPTGNGAFQYVASLAPDDWPALIDAAADAQQATIR